LLPHSFATLIAPFRCAFTRPTWQKVLVLLEGTLLASGRRTVTAALRTMGLQHTKHFNGFHHVLSRARWSSLRLSHLLLALLVRTFVPQGTTIEIVVDETLERRWGPHITKCAYYHDPVRSSQKYRKISRGLKWLCLMLIVTPPWTSRSWALPFLCVLLSSEEEDRRLGRRHKTVPDWTKQLVKVVRRWLPDRPIKLIGDGAYSVVELGTICRSQQITLIAPLRFDACLYTPPPARQPRQMGRPRLIGQRLPQLDQVLVDPLTAWHKAWVKWYGQGKQQIEWCSGTALWYRGGQAPLPIRWVLTRDLKGERDARAYFSTAQDQSGLSIIIDFMKRWCVEVTFEESRAHLGIETQRQWSDMAIERTTPCLFGLYSVVALLGRSLHPTGDIPFQQTAWYQKPQATFTDVLAAVRRHLWNNFSYSTSPQNPDVILLPRSDLARLADAVCSSA
jgi:DDE superfamily endonuclease